MTLAITSQRFETVVRKAAQSLQVRGGFQPVEALFRLPAEILECRNVTTASKFTRSLVSITEDITEANMKRRMTSNVIKPCGGLSA